MAHSLRTTIVAISHGTMRHHLIIQAPMDRAMDVNLGDHTSTTNPPPPSGQRRGKRMHRGVRLIARRTPHNYIPPCHFPSPLGQWRGRICPEGINNTTASYLRGLIARRTPHHIPPSHATSSPIGHRRERICPEGRINNTTAP